MPGGSPLLRRIGDGVDVVTYLGDYTRRRIAAALSPAAGGTHGPADARGRRPPRSAPASTARRSARGTGWRDRPVVVCVSRLMPRKGQDVLIAGAAGDPQPVPGAALLLVGGGPYRAQLERLVAARACATHVVFTGAVPAASCRRTTPPATCSRCRAVRATAAWTSRASASSSSRRRPAGCRSWPATPAARPTRSCPGETGYVVDGP